MRIAIDWKKRGREFLILTGIALFLAVLRPFGTSMDAPLGLIFGFWFVLVISGSTIGEVTVWALYKFWPAIPTWAMILITSIVTASGVSLVLLSFEWLSGGYVRVGSDNLLILYGYVFIISAAMTLLGYTLSRAFNAAGPDFVTETNDRAAVDAFLERLPIKYRTSDLYAVSSEDHYCRVHTSLGSELILMRLADVEKELSSVDGLRVHRSWWVSRKGIADSTREGGRITLKLRSGEDVPVSRSYQSDVKEAGLIH